MSNKTILEFNPDCMTMHDVKLCAQILRDLINRREQIENWQQHDPEHALTQQDKEQMFLASFDTLTQHMGVK